MNKHLEIGNSWTWNDLTFTVKKTESFLYNKSWLILVEGTDEGTKVFTFVRLNEPTITKEKVQKYYIKWHKPVKKQVSTHTYDKEETERIAQLVYDYLIQHGVWSGVVLDDDNKAKKDAIQLIHDLAEVKDVTNDDWQL